MVIRISYLPPFEAANVLFSIKEALCWGLTVENKGFQSLFCSAFSTHLGPLFVQVEVSDWTTNPGEAHIHVWLEPLRLALNIHRS